MADQNVVFVGKKPTMNYVLAVVMHFHSGADHVVIKARGKAIKKAVDVAELVRNRFIPTAKYEKISIGTENIETEKGVAGISSIEIVIKRA